MSQTIKTPHLIVLRNGETFTAIAHIISKNRYDNGIDYLYFETKESHEPSVDGAVYYHKWNFTKYFVTAWLVPMSEVKEIKDVS